MSLTERGFNMLSGKNDPPRKQETLKQKAARIESERPVVDTALLRSLGIDEVNFNKTYKALCEKWWDYWGPQTSRGDIVGKRFVSSILASHLDEPFILSMIVDNPSLFNQYYNEEKGDIYCLNFCCICGSERIIKEVFMMDPEKKQCLALSDDAIGYALSSEKRDLALFVANEAVKLGRKNSGSAILYTFGDQEGFHAVEQIFQQTQSAPLTPGRDSQGRTSPSQGDAHKMTSSGLYKSGL